MKCYDFNKFDYIYLHMQTAHGWDYQAQVEKHASQIDHTKGFGGKFGVQKDRQDKVYLQLCCCDCFM